MEALYIKKSEENLIEKINSLNNVDEILELVEKSRILYKYNLSIKTYIKVIKRCREINSKSINLALFCESLIKDKAILLNLVIDPVKRMYKKGIVTENTKDVINILELAMSSDKELSKILMKPKIKLGIIDDEFTEEFIERYKKAFNKNQFNKTIDIILDSKKVKYNYELINVIFYYYKKHGDIKALIRVFRELKGKDIDFIKYGITLKERILLIKAYKKDMLIDFNELIEYTGDFYKKSVYIRSAFIEIFEEKLTEGSKDTKEFIYLHYEDILKYLSNYSKIIYKAYMYEVFNLSRRDNLKRILVIENYLNNIKGTIKTSKKIELIERIINYYINTENENKYMEYIKYYFKNIASEDQGELFRRIIQSNKRDRSFLANFLMRNGLDLFKEVNIREYDYEMLSILSKNILKLREYELLKIILLRYSRLQNLSNIAKEKGMDLVTKSNESINSIKAVIKNCNKISEEIYNKGIIPIYNSLPINEKKNLYSILITRKDLPMDFREKNYEIIKDRENDKFIIEQFLSGKHISYLSKELALKEYFEDDFKFLSIASIGRNNERTRKIILEKISMKFLKDKRYVRNIILVIKERDRELRFISECIENYFNYENDIEKRVIFERFKICDRKYGEVCDKVRIKEIFTKEERSGYLFKNDGVLKLIKKYFNENKVSYDEIERKILIIKENILNKKTKDKKGLNLLDILNLIKLEQDLLLNGAMIINLKIEELVFINNVVFIKNLEKITKYKKELSNEKDIIKIMKYYLGNIEFDNELLRNEVIDKIVKNDRVENYSGLKNSIKEIINKKDNLNNSEFKEYKYAKYLEDFNILNDNFKERIIYLILKKNDIRKISKEIIIDYDFEGTLKNNNQYLDKYINYLIECFNYHYFDLSKFKLRELYEKIINLIKDNKENPLLKEYIKDNQNSFIELFINAPSKCRYKSIEIFIEAESLNIIEDRKYLESKLA